jgi:hypothetical protein
MVTPAGEFTPVEVAATPSLPNVVLPFPAIVLMIPPLMPVIGAGSGLTETVTVALLLQP